MINHVKFAMIVLLMTALTGCVSKSVHQQQLTENDHLKSVIKGLEADYEHLTNEKKQLLQNNSALNQKLVMAIEGNEQLQEELMRTRTDLERAEKILVDRSAAAGSAISEMRKEIEQLTANNSALQSQLEAERIEREARLAEVQGTYAELVDKLEQEIVQGDVKISELEGKLTVNVVDKILFDSGRADLKQAGVKVLTQIGDILKTAAGKSIQIEGHTDNVPISSSLKETYPSNWELSTARATTVLHFLQKRVGISGERLSAVGYGQYQPVASNEDSEGRAQNRRIQIVLTAAK